MQYFSLYKLTLVQYKSLKGSGSLKPKEKKIKIEKQYAQIPLLDCYLPLSFISLPPKLKSFFISFLAIFSHRLK